MLLSTHSHLCQNPAKGVFNNQFTIAENALYFKTKSVKAGQTPAPKERKTEPSRWERSAGPAKLLLDRLCNFSESLGSMKNF
jgi:hypothetical protein